MGGHAFKKTSGPFDCIFVQGPMFYTGREKSFMQSEETQIKLVILLLEHDEFCTV